MISAEVHSDDHCREAKFDATKWFEQATPADVDALIACGWGGDYPADNVATFMAGHDEGVKAVFAYIEAINPPPVGDTIGFECHVNEKEATEWLAAHDPMAAPHAAPTGEDPLTVVGYRVFNVNMETGMPDAPASIKLAMDPADVDVESATTMDGPDAEAATVLLLEALRKVELPGTFANYCVVPITSRGEPIMAAARPPKPSKADIAAAGADARTLMASTTVQMAWLTMLVSRQMNRIASGELSFALQQAVLPATADMPARKVHPLTEETLLQSAADKALQGFDQVEAMERLAVITKWLQGTVEKNAKLDMNTRQIEKAEAEKIRRTVSLPVSIPISPGHDGAMTRESSVVLVGYGPAIKILLDHAANAVLAAVDAQQPEHKFCIVRLADLMDTPPLIEETNRRYVQVGRKDWQGQFAMEKRVNQLMLGVVQPRLAAQPDLLIVDDLGAATSGVVGLGRVGVAPFNCNESNKKCLKWCHLAGASLLAGVPSLNPTGNSVGSREWEDLRNHAVLRPVNVIRGDDVPEGKVRIVVGKDAFVLEVDAVLLDGPSKIIV